MTRAVALEVPTVESTGVEAIAMTVPTRPTRLTDSQEDKLRLSVVGRLRASLPDTRLEEIERAVLRAYSEFQDSAVPTYLPILVERRARDALLAESPDRPAPSSR